jgi:hypothetical protein
MFMPASSGQSDVSYHRLVDLVACPGYAAVDEVQFRYTLMLSCKALLTRGHYWVAWVSILINNNTPVGV